MPEPGEPVKLKVCLIGDEGVGKTSLIRRFVLSEFEDRYIRTVGANVNKRIVVVGPVDGHTYAATLLVWDLLGNVDFVRRYGDAYLANAAGILAVCDLTRPDTVDRLVYWLDEVRARAGSVPVIVLANKRDLKELVRVNADDLLALCELYNLPYLETSALTGEGVERAFGALAEMALRAPLADRRKSGKRSVPTAPLIGSPRPS